MVQTAACVVCGEMVPTGGTCGHWRAVAETLLARCVELETELLEERYRHRRIDPAEEARLIDQLEEMSKAQTARG